MAGLNPPTTAAGKLGDRLSRVSVVSMPERRLEALGEEAMAYHREAMEPFVKAVFELRAAQTAFFKTRERATLQTCKILERQVDAMVTDFLTPQPKDLFK